MMKLVFTVLAVIGMFTFIIMSADSNEKVEVLLSDSSELSKVIFSEQIKSRPAISR
jgi:hypothetical protein